MVSFETTNCCQLYTWLVADCHRPSCQRVFDAVAVALLAEEAFTDQAQGVPEDAVCRC